MKTILVLPVYNEGSGLAPLIQEAARYVDEVIAVDDGSKDDTFQEIKKTEAVALQHVINLGKASAMKTGVEAALKRGAEIIIFMDSDGQHLPEDLPRFIEPIEKEGKEVVIGCRKKGKKAPFVRHMGNRAIQIMVRILFGIYIKDIQSGYRSFRTDVYDRLCWNSKRYNVDAEMSVRTGKYHLNYKQIPIETIYHDEFKGMTVIDGLKVLFQILIWRFSL